VIGLLLGSFLAGVLTTAAPCVLPVLPVILGGSVSPSDSSKSGADTRRAIVITVSLALSVMLFTIILRASTALIDVPVQVWTYFSGGILIVLGLTQVFARSWQAIDARLNLGERSNRLLPTADARSGLTGAIITGAALGPVFSSCSPLYGWIVATVLPTSWLSGLAYLSLYAVGLAGTLLVIALLGQRAIRRLRWAANPDGWFRRVIGVIFIFVGLAIITGLDRDVQTWLVLHGPFPSIWTFDQTFIPK
jgi:cytochrome c-type biogenesis protein